MLGTFINLDLFVHFVQIILFFLYEKNVLILTQPPNHHWQKLCYLLYTLALIHNCISHDHCTAQWLQINLLLNEELVVCLMCYLIDAAHQAFSCFITFALLQCGWSSFQSARFLCKIEIDSCDVAATGGFYKFRCYLISETVKKKKNKHASVNKLRHIGWS